MTTHISLPAGSSITLLPGRTEAITINALPQDPPPTPAIAPVVIEIVDATKGCLQYRLNGSETRTIQKGDTITINYRPNPDA